MNLDSELRRALGNHRAPAGFAARVAAAAAAAEVHVAPAHPRWRGLAAGLVITALAGGWMAERAIERREGERARREVMVALRIAGSKVKNAQRQVRELGSR